MKRAFVFRQTFRHTTVVHFNEIKLVKEDDIEDKERWSKNIGAKEKEEEEGRHLKRALILTNDFSNLYYNTTQYV